MHDCLIFPLSMISDWRGHNVFICVRVCICTGTWVLGCSSERESLRALRCQCRRSISAADPVEERTARHAATVPMNTRKNKTRQGKQSRLSEAVVDAV